MNDNYVAERRQYLTDTYRLYERELERALANTRRLEHRMARIATELIGTEKLTCSVTNCGHEPLPDTRQCRAHTALAQL